MGWAEAALPARNTVNMGPGVTGMKTSGRMLPPTINCASALEPWRAAVELKLQALRRRSLDRAFHHGTHGAGIGHVEYGGSSSMQAQRQPAGGACGDGQAAGKKFASGSASRVL